MNNRETLIKNVKEYGMKFPTRHRFVLANKEGKLSIISTENKSKIKIENEKFNNNRTILLDGSSTALLDIVDLQSAEEYADTVISLNEKWGILETEEEK